MKIRSVLFFIAISIVTTLISGSASADPLSIEVTNNPTSVFACHAVDGVVTAEGGSPPYSFSISGAPAGITLSDEGPTEENSVNIQGSTTLTETFNISITVEDEAGETETTTFTLTVKPNTSPTITNPGNKTFETGENTGKAITSFRFEVTDAEDTPSVEVSGLPDDLSYSYNAVTDSVTISGTLSANVSGTSTVTVTANDGCNTAVTETFEIKVDVNSAPTVTGPGNMSYFQGHTITDFTITVRDEDDTPAVTVGTLTIPPGISYSKSSSSYGTGGAEITYTFSGTVAKSALPQGFYVIGISANDGCNDAVSHALLFNVKKNTFPKIDNPGDKTFETGENIGKEITSFRFEVTDAEDTPSVEVSGLPDDLSYSYSTVTDSVTISGTLSANAGGTSTVTVTADDGINDPVTDTFTIRVNVNRKPEIVVDNQSFETGETQGKAITGFTVIVRDADDDNLTVTKGALPSGLSYGNASRRSYGTGGVQITYTVSGTLSSASSRSLTRSVVPCLLRRRIKTTRWR